LGCKNWSLADEGRGTIRITIPEITAKSWDNATAQAETNVYEVFIYNDTNQYTSGAITTTGTHDITVTTGTYNLIVLAGVGGTYIQTS